MGRPPKTPKTETPVTLEAPKGPVVKLTYADKVFTETLGHLVDTRDVVREMEQAKKNGMFWMINERYYNLLNIYAIDIVGAKKVIAPVAPDETKEEKSLEERQLEKQPELQKYKNVYNG